MSAHRLSERGVHIAEPGQPAIVCCPCYQRLSFCHRGGFATLINSQKSGEQLQHKDLTCSKTHGVLYKIGEQDFKKLAGSETGYGTVFLEVELYNSARTIAAAFVSRPALMLSKPLPPTRKYLNLILSGALEHALCPEYVTWLEGVRPHEGGPLGEEYFETPSTLYANLATALLAFVAGVLYLKALG